MQAIISNPLAVNKIYTVITCSSTCLCICLFNLFKINEKYKPYVLRLINVSIPPVMKLGHCDQRPLKVQVRFEGRARLGLRRSQIIQTTSIHAFNHFS